MRPPTLPNSASTVRRLDPPHLDRLAHEPCERRFRGPIRPRGEVAHPAVGRVAGDERLGEEHELRAGRGGVRRERVDALDRSLSVEDRRLGPDARDSDGAAHGQACDPGVMSALSRSSPAGGHSAFES